MEAVLAIPEVDDEDVVMAVERGHGGSFRRCRAGGRSVRATGLGPVAQRVDQQVVDLFGGHLERGCRAAETQQIGQTTKPALTRCLLVLRDSDGDDVSQV